MGAQEILIVLLYKASLTHQNKNTMPLSNVFKCKHTFAKNGNTVKNHSAFEIGSLIFLGTFVYKKH